MNKLFRIYESLNYPNIRKHDLSSKAELLSIVVDQKAQGSTISRQLMDELKKKFAQNGISHFGVVVSPDNRRANAYYQKMGGVRVSDLEVHKGQTSNVFHIKTNS